MMTKLIHFASEHDPSFPEKIQGASEEDIAHLEQLAGRPLPALYREFLKHMGRSMGDVGYSDVTFNIDSVARLHRNEDQEYNWPRQYLVIAEHEQDPYFNFFLDLGTLKDGDCPVVRFDIELNAASYDPDHIAPEAPSLTTLLFEMVFLSKHLARFPQYSSIALSFPELKAKHADPVEVVDVFERAAIKLGFRKRPDSRPEHTMLERADAAIYGKGSWLGTMGVTMTTQDARELAQLREVLSDYAVRH